MVIAIYGLGLIGGSLGRAIREKTPHKVFGRDINPQTVLEAKLLKAIDDEITDENLKGADLAIFALSPSDAISEMEKAVPKLKDGAAIIDCCGTKRRVIRCMESLHERYPNLEFAGVHPMAGRESCGISNSTEALFENTYAIVTPVKTSYTVLDRIISLLREIGCKGIRIATAEKHDEMIAYTSQLAHVISVSYVKNPLSEDHRGFSAGSFQDMTRVARLNPRTWTELLLENRDNVILEIEVLEKNIADIKSALVSNDAALLNQLLTEGVRMKEVTDRIAKDGKDS
jgi:prephenate dehydrogenase